MRWTLPLTQSLGASGAVANAAAELEVARRRDVEVAGLVNRLNGHRPTLRVMVVPTPVTTSAPVADRRAGRRAA